VIGVRKAAVVGLLFLFLALIAYAFAPPWVRFLMVPSPVVAHDAAVASDEVRALLSLASSRREGALSPLPTEGTVRVFRHRWFSWLRTRGGTVLLWEQPGHTRTWHFSKPNPSVRLTCEEEVFYARHGEDRETLTIAVGIGPGGGACPAEWGTRIERRGEAGARELRPEDVGAALEELGWSQSEHGGA
jgi:hypothetical protein